MHYYSHNINDFNNATIHLSVEEECMYHRALSWYYSNEIPLPKDKAKVYRFLRATTKKLQTAVNNILDDFFTEEIDGFHQSRCDSEIAEYQAKQQKAVEAGKASAEARRKSNPNKASVEQENNVISSDVQQETNDRSTTVQPTNNQEPRTNINNSLSNAGEEKSAEQVFEKVSQICEQNAQNIQDWQAPSLAEISDMLKMSGFTGQITSMQYTQAIADFKTHWAEEALKGNPLVTDSKRKNKLRDWIRNGKEFKTSYSKPKSNQPQYGGINDPMAVNAKWGIVEDYAPTMTIDELMAEKEAKRLAREQASQSTATAKPNRQPKGLIEL